MALSDGTVAYLARQAMDLLDPDVDMRIEPGVSADPYRLSPAMWTVQPLFERAPTFGIRLRATMTPQQALAELVKGLSDGVAQSPHFWARVFPTCGDHEHASVPVVEENVVMLRCPVTNEERGWLLPDILGTQGRPEDTPSVARARMQRARDERDRPAGQ